jgi:hypothetical protein
MPRFSYAQCRANRERAAAEADVIVRRLLETNATCKAIGKEYGVGSSVLWEIFEARTTPAQRKAAKVRKQQQHMNSPVGSPSWLKARIRKGERRAKHGRTAWVPIGTIRVRHDHGKKMKVVKVRDTGPRSCRWRILSHEVWERKFGPIPDHLTVEFKDGNAMNCALENLRLVTRGERLKKLIRADPGMLTRRAERIRTAKRRQSPQRQGVAARFRAVRGPLRSWFECAGCGDQVDAGEIPEKCPKCQGLRFVKVTQRAA